MANYTIRPINTGFIPANLKLYHYHHSVTKYYPEIEAGMQMTPCFAFLLENNGEYCLVDTGMSSTERANKYHHPGSQQDPGMAIHEQLAALGIACEQIKTVILTHMHWDHVYNLEKFKHARIVANETELAFAKNPIPLYYKSYEHPFLGIQAPFTGLDIETCSGEQEILPGVRVFETPGHSPGHMSVKWKPNAANTSLRATARSGWIILRLSLKLVIPLRRPLVLLTLFLVGRVWRFRKTGAKTWITFS